MVHLNRRNTVGIGRCKDLDQRNRGHLVHGPMSEDAKVCGMEVHGDMWVGVLGEGAEKVRGRERGYL
ncbi:unnamed protein product [Prunus armeniaca]|uniref:Uncharacterized protein n=1 Tax=Prunus armeniaca TaxID=36596 RepID=A0A6J5UBN3_PRUAR|nr:unnamed protein product [Prunus armeniaca]